MNVEKPTFKQELSGIYSLTYIDNYDLCMSLVRLQEFYESPAFKGRYFTFEEYMDYWSRDFGHGVFDYPVVWGGFNIPGNIVLKWFQWFGCNMRPRELELFEVILMNIPLYDFKKSYFIFVAKDSKDLEGTLRHEIAHGMYSLVDEYKTACDKLLKNVAKKPYDIAVKQLIKMGYDDEMIMDELQAYWSTTEELSIHKSLKVRSTFKTNYEIWREKLNVETCDIT